jgi:hypothetical protein
MVSRPTCPNCKYVNVPRLGIAQNPCIQNLVNINNCPEQLRTAILQISLGIILNSLKFELWLRPSISVTRVRKLSSKNSHTRLSLASDTNPSTQDSLLVSLTTVCYPDARISVVSLCPATKPLISSGNKDFFFA